MSAQPDDPGPSYGNVGDQHWTRARRDANREAIEHYRRRSRAPGVAEGGGLRAHYCMSCDGVLPLAYDSREPASRERATCLHCGAELEGRVRAMFNWVETDQVPESDLRALLPLALAVVVVVGLGVAALALWL